MDLKTIPVSKKIAGIALLLVLFLAFSKVLDYLALQHWQREMYTPGLQGKTVIIDPGHGGADPGATVEGVREADLNMAVALAVRKKLEQKGVKVWFTREGDQGLVPASTMTRLERWLILENRKRFALDKKGDILLSIHMNSNNDPRASGAIVYYADEKSRELAVSIQNELNKLGLRERQAEQADFNIINGNRMPSVLVEAGFLTNKKDREFLLNKRDILAQAICDGLQVYADNLKGAEGSRPDQPDCR